MTLVRWRVDIIIRAKRPEHLGIVEAPNHREAYLKATEKFDVPLEKQNCLFVAKLDQGK